MNVDPAKLLDAAAFAADKHSRQRRKDAAASPYINHPLAVARILAAEAGVRDEDLLLAALLHDTVEDTATSFAELERLFGARVRQIVGEVTDDKSLPKATRKNLQVEHAARASDAAKLLKISDKICNVRDITHHPPADWSAARKTEYLAWAKTVVAGCRGINAVLDKLFDAALTAAGTLPEARE